ncbi:MAG: response regulator transcription factor [Rhodospirillaceae bacterium]|nr:response regulator transcription factor [Rhodospirillaceae bacterium]MBT4940787.1 response regulator transcription factor [Rhodospirillaceae bacterium]MBT5938614.1 response regulator transcription factor [Rhodospirillaceae bacterium]
METQKTVLAVDDDPNVLEVVTDCLETGGYNVITSPNGQQALSQLENNKVDLIVVDLGLPDIDGLELTRSFKMKSDAGVIILSGRADTTEKVVGLEIGADDYLTKPFEPRELLARARSVLRRAEASGSPAKADDGESYQFDGWNLNISRREFFTPDGDMIELTSGEFDFLKVFVEHPNRILSRDQILDFAYTNDSPAYDRSVDIRIARLRKKIERDPKAPQWIKTVRNAGYIFTAAVSSAN